MNRPPVSPEFSNGTDGCQRGQSSAGNGRSGVVRAVSSRVWSPGEIDQSDASDTLYAYVFATPFGWMGLLGGERGLVAVKLGEETEPEAWSTLERTSQELGLMEGKPADTPRQLPQTMAAAARTLAAYVRNGWEDLSGVQIDYRSGTELQRRIWDATREIPGGETLSYKALAERVGLPRGARPTGQAMARNHLLLVVPCHRVVSSTGALTGYSNPRGLGLKQRLLDHEAAGTR